MYNCRIKPSCYFFFSFILWQAFNKHQYTNFLLLKIDQTLFHRAQKIWLLKCIVNELIKLILKQNGYPKTIVYRVIKSQTKLSNRINKFNSKNAEYYLNFHTSELIKGTKKDKRDD